MDQNLKAETGFKFSSYVSDRCYVSNGGKIHFITHLLRKNEKMCLAKRHDSKVLILLNIKEIYCIHSRYDAYSMSTQKYHDSHIHNYLIIVNSPLNLKIVDALVNSISKLAGSYLKQRQ